MRIAFDAAKNGRNIAERGLSFESAAAFDFSTAIVAVDDRKAYAEVRYVALGWLGARLHVLCFTPIEGGIRVISFRKANSREIKAYGQARTID
ncbi:BrnT family toxin [Pseudorhodoferax sp.]|uniref:BrnT family toxin n=1 Tax=Pseudorhodoferax sp. TaxID=1993553 RepID=UPI002DD6B787|nr:BrnT family toxin [Pseudorhodoferax sp.]